MGNGMNHLQEFEGFRLDAERLVLWHQGEPVPLPPKEIELLSALVDRHNEVVSKDELMSRVWADSFVEESNISRHIYRLRKMFVEFGMSADLIQTVPRRGYRFTGDVHASNDLVVERHFVSRTVVEAFHDTDEPAVGSRSIAAGSQRLRKLLLPAFACVAVLLTVAAAYYYNQPTTTNSPIFRSIAVLPFNDIDNAGERSAGLGFADALITRLGTVDNVRVLSSNAVVGYADRPRDPIDVGRELGVDAVIDGTLQRANGKLRVNIRATRISDGKQLWSNTFDESELEVFRLQDTLATQTARALSLNIREIAGAPTANRDAYRFYVEGLYLFRRRETSRSVPLMKKAIELDPKFAKPWSLLAAAYAMGDSMPEAEAAANRAIELDQNLGQAHAVRGFIKIFLDWDAVEAERSLDRAVELDPNSVEAYHWRGILRQTLGRFSEAKSDLERAFELDPTSGNLVSDLGHIHYFAREYARAEELYNKAETLSPNIVGSRFTLLYKRQGRDAEAFQAELNTVCNRLGQGMAEECKAEIRQRGGMVEYARENIKQTLASFKNDPPKPGAIANQWHTVSLFYNFLGDRQGVIRSLNKALDSRVRYEVTNFTFPFIEFDPIYDEIRGEPEFAAIVKRLRNPSPN